MMIGRAEVGSSELRETGPEASAVGSVDVDRAEGGAHLSYVCTSHAKNNVMLPQTNVMLQQITVMQQQATVIRQPTILLGVSLFNNFITSRCQISKFKLHFS
jgi:16S rRNA U1498 N3-methylase RsmE